VEWNNERNILVTTKEILALSLPPNDAGAATIGDYLRALLESLWIKEEGFSGKRPFGNSGWKFSIFEALVRANLVEGTFEDGSLEHVDKISANTIILTCIKGELL
jgi:hypothetical protein